jgi:hypothetical protein
MEKIQEILHPVPILNKKKELTRQKGDRKIRKGAAALSEPIDRVKGHFLEIKKEFTFYPFQKDTKFCVRNYLYLYFGGMVARRPGRKRKRLKLEMVF